jgi:MurNAc alpha-1-phosphate uridylyltransferase
MRITFRPLREGEMNVEAAVLHPRTRGLEQTVPTRAMVLAAGIGKHMRPLTVATPKPLIEVGGRALIDHVLDRLEQAGIEMAAVSVHYLPQLLRVHLARRRTPNIIISDESSALLDTGGGIRNALPSLGEAPFFVVNADAFWIEGARPNLGWLKRSWREEQMDALLMVASTVRSVGYDGRGDFRMDPTGRLTRRGEREVAPFAYAGAAILHPRLFAEAPAGAFGVDWLFDRAAKAGRLYGMRMDGLWIRVNGPEAIAAAEISIADSAA